MGRKRLLSCTLAAKGYNAGMAREDIAFRYNVSRETVNRALREARAKGLLIPEKERAALIMDQALEDDCSGSEEVMIRVSIPSPPPCREPGDWGWGKYTPSPGVIEATKEDVARQLGRRNRKPLVLHKEGGEFDG